MLTVEQALEQILTRVPVLAVEGASLLDSLGRVLAEPVTATREIPPWDNSSMDGYAVRGEDIPTDTPQLFRVVGRLQAGNPATGRPLGPGEAIRIFTGAPVPVGADRVVIHRLMEDDLWGSAEAGLPNARGIRLSTDGRVRRSLNRGSATGRALLDRRVLVVEDVKALSSEEFPEQARIQAGTGNRSTVYMPLLSRGEPIGILNAMRMEVRPFTEREVAYLKEHEWARSAEDILWRRTKCGLRMTDAQRSRVAQVVGR